MHVTNSMAPWSLALLNVSESAANEALRQIQQLPGVKELQQLVEAAQAQATTASSYTEAPASAGPVLAPPVEQPQVGEAVAVSQAQAPSGSVAERVLERAYAEEDSIHPMKRGEDGHYKGWKQLQHVFEKTTGWRPTDAECTHLEPGKGAKPGGKSWCGIWACHILQEAGVDVKWDLTKGKMVGDVTHVPAPKFSGPAQYKAERSAFEQSVRPGDVITLKGSLNHHAIVTKVHPDGTVETMDGNKPHVGRGKAKLTDVTSYYRPNAA
jgi:hypothetical protein